MRFDKRNGFELRPIVINLMLALASFFICFVIIEVCLRAGVIKNKHYNRMKVDRDIKTDQKLLIIGDSFLAKESLVNTEIVRQLDQMKILNIGLGGLGPLEYLSEFKSLGLEFHPDMLLLSVYAGNDVTDIQYKSLKKPAFLSVFKTKFRVQLRKLYFYHYIKESELSLNPIRFDFQRMSFDGVDPHFVELAKKQEINPWYILLAAYHPNFLSDSLLLENPESQIALRQMMTALDEIKNICLARNIKMMVVIFPAGMQIDKTQEEFFNRLKFNIDQRIFTSDIPQREINSFCSRTKTPCLDLLPDFRDESKKRALYQFNDIHLNPEGQIFAAEKIANFILKNQTK